MSDEAIILVAHAVLGAMLLLVAGVTYRYPPAELNYLYGYRTTRSMRNADTWREANAYASRYFVRMALGFVVVEIVSLLLFEPETSLYICLGLLLVGVVSILVVTERHLARHFDQQGRRIR